MHRHIFRHDAIFHETDHTILGILVKIFLGTFQIFPSTQTEQNLGHFTQAFRNYCSSLGVRQSMGAVGTSADNALAESFNATLKREVLRDRKLFESPISCRQEVFRWCMGYNTRRCHSWCNLVAPDVFEAETSATLTKAAQLPPTCPHFGGQALMSNSPNRAGNKKLKNALWQSSFASIRFHERSRQFYERKRKEGKRLNAAAT